MSKRERAEEGPEYILLEIQDSMEASTSYYYYAPRSGLTSEYLENLTNGEVEMYDEDGELTDYWKTLQDEGAVRKFTQDHWCEVIVINNDE